MSETVNNGPLADIRVLELGQLIAGPFCGQLLGDMGAEIIKLEPPGVGDAMRDWGRGVPVWWSVIARNKKSATLNLREPRGQQLLRDLVAHADILIENFRPGTMEKWGLGYAELAKINRGLIMVRVSGFGQTGPYAERAGYGSVGEAMGGIRYIAGDPDRPPVRAGLSIGDSLAATFACVGALAALHHRSNSGVGQVVDSAIYEAVLAMMESTVPEYSEGGLIRERSGAILPKTAPSNVYPTRSGEMIVMGANQDSVFSRLVRGDASGPNSRAIRASSITSRAARTRRNSTSSSRRGAQRSMRIRCCSGSTDFGVPAGRIYRAPDMLADPHFAARRSIVDVPHPEFKHLKMQDVFPRMSATQGTVRWPGPPLGAHNDEVYGELLGLDEAARRAARPRDGVI